MNPLRLLVLLTLFLSVVCNAELRTWTAVNGKEVEAEFVSNEKGIIKLKLKTGKVFKVPADKLSKEDNEFISSLAKPEGGNLDEELEYREGFYYLLDSDTPYTGKAFTLWKNGQKETESNYKDGKQDGLQFEWHENGQKSWKGNFKGGKPNGLWVNWHENGQKQLEENYKDGKAYGVKMEWHPNGQKKMEGNFKDNKAYGLWVSWHENGQKKKEVNYKDGEEVEGSAKFWNSKGEPVDSLEEAE